ncbi:protein of unknown function DUF152 [Thermocrinis albus DSM 14484]|uniref:Purine nucleoside phosphorylase n=1 Tax=Thermocrinis albus (strain DSM 14484 / JCM 11386 / HI 11/12) TaxID=638303 RepID=D3SNS8_THEAH|nr:polyphenol oxidase family protein [Thermocrinis albus]ADC88815.1 protein of unknown function DUF152 [Thermocrinis albus DSM 14484]
MFSFRYGKVLVGMEEHSPDSSVITLQQVHSSRVVPYTGLPLGGTEGDGIITTLRGVRVGVKTADCLPVVLATGNAVAVVHAGWRGLAQGILERAVEMLKPMTQEDAWAFLGPSAKHCCYRVGDEFIDIFTAIHVRNRELYMDLQEEALLRLKKLGIRRFFLYQVCTICHSSLPSHRRDRTTRRILTWAMLLPEEET